MAYISSFDRFKLGMPPGEDSDEKKYQTTMALDKLFHVVKWMPKEGKHTFVEFLDECVDRYDASTSEALLRVFAPDDVVAYMDEFEISDTDELSSTAKWYVCWHRRKVYMLFLVTGQGPRVGGERRPHASVLYGHFRKTASVLMGRGPLLVADGVGHVTSASEDIRAINTSSWLYDQMDMKSGGSTVRERIARRTYAAVKNMYNQS